MNHWQTATCLHCMQCIHNSMTTNSESKNGLTEGKRLSKITKTWHKTYQIAATATFTVCSVSKMHNKLWTEKYCFEKVHISPKSPNLSNSSYCKYFGSKKRGGEKSENFYPYLAILGRFALPHCHRTHCAWFAHIDAFIYWWWPEYHTAWMARWIFCITWNKENNKKFCCN